MVGISNFLNVAYAYQERSGNPPTQKQSLVADMWEHSESYTLDQTIDLIDKWYDDHPDKRDTAVLEVIWDQMIEPKLKAAKITVKASDVRLGSALRLVLRQVDLGYDVIDGEVVVGTAEDLASRMVVHS